MPTLVLVAPSPITHSRIWKALLPDLARRYRVVTFDGRGNGRSGRPTTVEEHTRAANVADIVGVLDASDTETAVVVAHCHANWWVVDLIDAHPSRVEAFVAIAPGVPYLGPSQPHWAATAATWGDVVPNPSGWLCSTAMPSPTTTAAGWSSSSPSNSSSPTRPSSSRTRELAAPDRLRFEQQCRGIAVPTPVVHGDQDVCQHVDKGRAFAELVGAELVVMEGAGHLALVSDPVTVNRAITDFVDRTTAGRMPAHRTRPTPTGQPGLVHLPESRPKDR